MKTKFALLAFLFGRALGFAADNPAAAPIAPTPARPEPVERAGPSTTLRADAAVFLQPDGTAPVIARFKAGSTIPLAHADAPAGWRAVEVHGPFEAFVQNKSVGKDLDVKFGTTLHLAPAATSPIYGIMSADDKAELTGLRGDWSQVKLEKTVVGYIAVGEAANRPATAATPTAPALVAVTPAPTTEPGRAVTTGTLTADTPRLLQGRLVAARRPIFNPNPLYDYQLSDNEGRRLAYLDTRRLLFVDKIENYLDRVVSISGTLRNTVDGKDLVIEAESIQPK